MRRSTLREAPGKKGKALPLVFVPGLDVDDMRVGHPKETEEPSFRRLASLCEFSFGSNLSTTRSRKRSVVDCGSRGDGQFLRRLRCAFRLRGNNVKRHGGRRLHRLLFELVLSGWVDLSL